MYSQFRKLTSGKDRSELQAFVESSSADELSLMITERICNAESPRVLGDLLKGFTNAETSQTKRRKVVEAIFRSMFKAKVTNSHVDSIVNRIVLDFPQYSKTHLVKLVEFCQDRIRLNDDDFMCWKDVLPLLLEILEEEKFINYKGNEISGSEYKSLIVQSICNNPWDTAILTSLAKMFREISVEKGDHETIVRALFDKLSDIELNELPPLVYQLLRLCSNQDGRLLLGTLQKYFSTKYAEAGESQNMESFEEIGVVSLKEIQELESTILYHIYDSAQLNHASLKDFVSSLKKVTTAPEFILDPFLMAVLLCVSNIYEDQIFDVLKQAMYRKIQDDEKRNTSAWLRTVLPDDCRIVGVIDQVIINSNKDRHLVQKGLVDLAFVLMNGDKRARDEDRQLNDIGIRIIQKLIRSHHEIGATVLQQLTEKIVGGGSAISQYTDCLSYICRKLTLIVLDSQAWVVSLLDQLLTIPGDAATQVLHAILPMMRVSPTIRDALVLILRKALYRKGTYTRQMAVIGFLQLLKNLKINNLSALSQSGQNSSASASSSTSIFTQITLERHTQSTKLNPRCNIALCHEVLSILKRCFTHEVDVRLHLYKGLFEAVMMNPELSEYVMYMLITHFNVYYESDIDVKPPLKFNICSDIHGPEAVLQEPIGDLIFVMQRIYIKMASKDSSTMDTVAMILESLCKRMTQTELEHLNLDDRTDLLDDVPKSQQKLHTLKLMVTVYESLMAYKIGSWSTDSVNVAQSINSLFKSYNELVEFSKRIAKPKKAEGKNKKDKDAKDTTMNKRGRTASIKLPNTIMDLETVHKILCLLYKPSVPWATKEQAALLKRRPEFHHYILQTAIQLFHNAKTLKNVDLQRHQELHIKLYLEIGELLYKQIVSELNTIRDFDQQTGVMGLECFKELCDLICSSFETNLPSFLNLMLGEVEPSASLPSQIQSFIKNLQVLVEAYFGEETEDEVISKKIPVILLDTISILLHKVSFETAKVDKVFDWLKKIAQNTEVEAPIALLLIQLLTMIEERAAENGETLHELCIELYVKIGTMDESEISFTERFKCLTEISAVQAHSILSSAIKCKLNNATWFLGRLKAEQYIASSPGLGDESLREKLRNKEKSLCQQLSYVINTLQSLSIAAIDPGPNTDSTFKNIHQMYKVIGDLTKYFFNKSTAQSPAFQAVKFIQLVDLAGKMMKNTTYNLITYTEANQNNRTAKANSHAQRNKVVNQMKFIPNVVFEMEVFDKEIMQLGKKTNIPLENHLKHSTTRDFRIIKPQLAEGLEQLNVSLQVTQNTQRSIAAHPDETNNSSNDSDTDEPVAKKLKSKGSP